MSVVNDELGPLADGWVRLHVEACGICGTDLHSWRDAHRRRLGSTPGHELVGTIREGPAGLADALYAVNPNVNCGVCEFCVVGEPQLCRRGGYGIGMGRDGGLAELVDVPVANAYAVDQQVGVLEASLAEPLAVAVRAASLARPDLNSRVLIVGGGTVGLLMAIVLRDVAREIAVTTRYAHQKEAATAIGVRGLDEGEAEEWGKEYRPDVVIETVGGDGSSLRAAMRAARRGARVEAMRALIARIPEGSKFIIALDHHETRWDEKIVPMPWVLDYAQAMRELAAEYPYVGVVSFTEVIQSQDEIQAGGNHYNREVYWRMANHIVEVIQELPAKARVQSIAA